MESQHCHCLLVLTCGLALSAGFPTDASRQLQEIVVRPRAELQSEDRGARTLSAACHPSLLPLLGVCLAPARACLVYPLSAAAAAFEDRLYRTPAALQRLRMLGFETPPPPLSSAARLRVPRDAARALHYLHTLSPMILHRDVSAGCRRELKRNCSPVQQRSGRLPPRPTGPLRVWELCLGTASAMAAPLWGVA
ncbi:hypothetical protein EMIHUDRAFT_218241 [Emiliania huxleyi CCMP1516]|uniref:PUB domain-containing protein n=2 Tax=Emiliania huxleyi TaxID=2903 RepID=A0A0D3I8X7_EMIH1|nr:hypothetical protein EMIHUDRAFT_218241 [Emiliania huxleyi CCMP1516]EOD07712.1 hypothetical protein EMIHUDRAFT_218241 [Emiliania huxleyi CCMP1516]|eukprot:XP_005760141.1 hypothetical protein EMIHUDRAFT_218241 [Emiliania huxleyi CCMP1516]